MKHYLIAERYAKGLSAAIPDSSQLESVLAGVMRLGELYETEHNLRSAVANPAIDVDKRAAVLTEVLKEENLSTVVTRLADVLLHRGRISLLPDVASVFAMIVDERLNRVTASVTTAVALSDSQRDRLKSSLEKFSGETVSLDCDVDAAILGGVVTRMGGTVIDGSLRTRLERMKHTLLVEETS